MADQLRDGFEMPEGLNLAQQRIIANAVANARAEGEARGEARGRAAQLAADEGIIEEAKEIRRQAAHLRYIFQLQHRCKTVYRELSPRYSF